MSIYKGSQFIAGTPDLTEYAKTTDLLNAIYPVGSVYIGTQSSCPLSSLISGSTWQQLGTSLITSVNTSVPIKGDGKTIGLTNGSTNHGMIQTQNSGIWTSLTSGYGGTVGTAVGGAGKSDNLIGLTTDSSKSGIVGTVTRTSISVYIFKRTA